MATGLPDLDGFVNEVEEGFLHSFRRELFATRFFSHSATRDLSITKREWREISDDAGARVTMEIPSLEAQSGLNITKKEVEIPIFTKDLTYDGRSYDAYLRAGLDVEDARQAGLAMAEEINDYMYWGGQGKSGTLTLPGAGYGLLNNPDMQTLDNSGSTNWTNPTDVRADLSEAVKDMLVAGHVPQRTGGGYQLLMNPADSDLMTYLRTETDSSTEDLLPKTVGSPIWDRAVDANKAYLIAVSPDNFDAVGPFSPGSVMSMRDDPGREGLLMGKPIWVRHLSAITPRIKRGDAVMEITFDRS